MKILPARSAALAAVLDPVGDLRPLGVVETVQVAHQIAGDPADPVKAHRLEPEALGLRHAVVVAYFKTADGAKVPRPPEISMNMLELPLVHRRPVQFSTSAPPHSTRVKPLRAGGASNCCGDISNGASSGQYAMNTRMTVSGAGVTVSRAWSL